MMANSPYASGGKPDGRIWIWTLVLCLSVMLLITAMNRFIWWGVIAGTIGAFTGVFATVCHFLKQGKAIWHNLSPWGVSFECGGGRPLSRLVINKEGPCEVTMKIRAYIPVKIQSLRVEFIGKKVKLNWLERVRFIIKKISKFREIVRDRRLFCDNIRWGIKEALGLHGKEQPLPLGIVSITDHTAWREPHKCIATGLPLHDAPTTVRSVEYEPSLVLPTDREIEIHIGLSNNIKMWDGQVEFTIYPEGDYSRRIKRPVRINVE